MEGKKISYDSWSWGEENSDQDWNNGWSKPEFQHGAKNASGFGNNTGTYGGGNNNSQPASTHQSNQRQGVWAQPDQPHLPPNSTADYFPSMYPPPMNNNTFPEVENKEIAPPDHHQSAGKRQPMKLGSKQGQQSVARNSVGSSFGNVQHVQNIQHVENVPPSPFSHPGENHHQVPVQPTYNTQLSSVSRGKRKTINEAHHYDADNREDLFQTKDSNSWSYFDQMGGPMSMPPQHIPPPSMSTDQPHSLPPEHLNPPNNFFQDPPNRPLHHEPQNISYFQMQDKMENFQNFNSSEPFTREADNSHRSPKHETTVKEPPRNPDPIGNQVPLPGKDIISEWSVDNFPKNQFDDRPQSSVHEKHVGREHQHPQQGNEPLQAMFSDKRSERFAPQGFEDSPNNFGAQSKDWNRPIQPPPLSIPVEGDKPESYGPKFSAPQQQMPEEVRTDTHEWSGFQPPPQVERPMSREWSGFQPPVDRPISRERSAPPPSSQSERPVSRERSLPPQPVLPETTGSQDWRGSQHLPQGERPSSQGRERPNHFPPDRTMFQEKIGHQRTGSLGSDRSGSIGRELSSSERSGSSKNNATNRSDPTTPRNESSGSRSELYEPPGPQIDLAGSKPDPPRHRNDTQVPRPNQAVFQSDLPKPRTENSAARPDRVVPSRSPGAGEDRSSPPSRPDNLESLPPESHITQQMTQLSLQAKDKMGDCPLDRNEYLETSQLSNQESVETDIRASRHPPSDSGRNSHRGEIREVVGEAEPVGGRVVVGHTTPTTTPPPHNHSDEVEGGGSGSMERMVVGERREQSSRNNRSSRRRNHHRRESSYEEDDQDYSSDNRRGHRDDYRRDERHRNKRGQDHRSSDFMSDEEYEIDRRAYSRRDRRGGRDRDREDYRRDYYRDDHRRSDRGGGGGRDHRYRYEDDEYSYRERSRPSSRSGSDYRRANLEYQARNQAGPYFNHSLAGVLGGGREYEANPEYFEMLRKTNPVLYAIWYQDYMRKLQDTATHSAFTQSDRASIHSGQSSGNRLQVSTPSQVLDSNIGNVDSFDDYSPRLFSTPHVRGSYDGQGRLVVVNACSPLDGQQASVQLLSVEPEDQDPSVKEFLDSPGPFIPGVTHRSTVLQYLRKMSDQAAKGSEKLLYDLIHLIVKSNGKPDATDISELLLESYRNSKGDSRDDWDPDPSAQPISHQDMLSTFRSLLHQGNKQEALEWAMRHNGWGHALFLASKMDARTQNRVAGEFARSLAASDPLSTLYQVMSGGVPAAATACSDRRWADWRPHLAMVLSNLTDKPATDLDTLTTLADGLASRGRLYAAHSCYIIAQVIFGDMYRSSEGLVLLGCSDPGSLPQQSLPHTQLHLRSFNYKSFLLTLCYEYAVKQGQPNFFIPALQRYKLLVAWRLVEWGRGRQALLYCELLASEALRPNADHRSALNCDLVHLLVELSSALKALDPSCAHAANDLSTTPDPDWLQQLKQLAASLPQEEAVEPTAVPAHTLPEQPPYSNFEPVSHVPMYRTSGNMDGGYSNQMRVEETPVHSIPETQPPMDQPTSTSTPSKSNEIQQQVPHQMQPVMQPVMQPLQPITQPLQQPNSLPPVASIASYPQPGFSSQPQSFTGYEESGTTEVDHPADGGILPQPAWEPEKTIEPPMKSSNKSTNFFHASETFLQDENKGKGAVKPSMHPQGASLAEGQKKSEIENGSGGGGWFGGLLEKWSKNKKSNIQMILPDDKDPKIVFDEKLKKWVDREKEGGGSVKELKPPPTGMPGGGMPGGGMPGGGMPGGGMPGGGVPLSNVGLPPGNPGISSSNLGMAGPPMNTTNIYKLPKGKSMKSNYIDVLSNSGGSSKVKGSMEPMMPVPAMAAHSDPVNPNYFVPQQVDGSENKGPYGQQQMHNDNPYHGQLSRSSSMSSLSREVQHYMDRPKYRRIPTHYR